MSAASCPAVPPNLPGLGCPLAQLSPKLRRKLSRKWHQTGRSLAPGLSLSVEPTACLALANAGLHNGVGVSELLAGPADALQDSGPVRILQPAGRPYCLLAFPRRETAAAAATKLQLHRLPTAAGSAADREIVLYAFFVAGADAAFQSEEEEEAGAAVDVAEAEVALTSPRPDQLPPGASLTLNAVSPAEEAELLAMVDAELAAAPEAATGRLRKRQVLHWGHEFLYGSNRLAPLNGRPLPTLCATIAERLLAPAGQPPADQLTVNVYEPGGGIPAHVDSHAACGDALLSISLGSACAFRLSRAGWPAVCLHLASRSALLLTGESRLLWSHEVPARRADLVAAGPPGCCDLVPRGRRVSLTFRRARPPGQPCRCGHAGVCNDASEEPPRLDAGSLEREFVHSVYDHIAEHFSNTRHSRWPRVAEFLGSLPAGCLLLDVGCGNGKNMLARPDLLAVGCDRSARLCGVCTDRGLPVFQADALRLPVREAAFDAAVCIAVLHHLSTAARRAAALRELARACRPSASLLVYVWALEQRRDGRPSAYLREAKKSPKPEAAGQQQPAAPSAVDVRTGLGVHRPGAEFAAPDVLVPWRSRGGGGSVNGGPGEQLRFYHLFSEGELDRLCLDSGLFQLDESYYDNGNWCVRLARNCVPA